MPKRLRRKFDETNNFMYFLDRTELGLVILEGEMQAYKNLLWSCAAIASGIGILLLSTIPFYGPGSDLGWMYQLVVGVVMILVGCWSAFEVSDEKTTLIPAKMYEWGGFPLLLAGFLVFFNFNRYNEVFSRFGTWPIYLIGAWMTVVGCMILAHYLTVFEPASPKQSIL